MIGSSRGHTYDYIDRFMRMSHGTGVYVLCLDSLRHTTNETDNIIPAISRTWKLLLPGSCSGTKVRAGLSPRGWQPRWPTRCRARREDGCWNWPDRYQWRGTKPSGPGPKKRKGGGRWVVSEDLSIEVVRRPLVASGEHLLALKSRGRSDLLNPCIVVKEGGRYM